jgi:hypothetical protein
MATLLAARPTIDDGTTKKISGPAGTYSSAQDEHRAVGQIDTHDGSESACDRAALEPWTPASSW